MMRAMIPLVGLILAAAGPTGSFITSTPMPDYTVKPKKPVRPNTPPGFDAAPTPNQDASAPTTRASKDGSVGPGFFTRRDQYTGEGISPSSSVQADQERKARPGVGFSLTTPLQ